VQDGTEETGIRIIVSAVKVYGEGPLEGAYATGIAAFNFVAQTDPKTVRLRTTELTPIEDHKEVQRALEKMRDFALGC
jgi:hypothetical protein